MMADALIVICTTVLASPLVLFLVYTLYVFYQHSRYSHIPGPKRTSFYLGNLTELRRWRKTGNTVDLFFSWTLEHGNVFVFWAFHSPVLFVSEPDLMKKCVLTLNLPKSDKAYSFLRYPFGIRIVGTGIVSETNHKEWQWKRAMLNPAFHRKYLMNLMEELNKTCDIFLEKMGRLADGKTRVSMCDEFARVTLDIIGKVGFNIDTNTITDEHSPFPPAISLCLEGIQKNVRTPFWRFQPSMYPYVKKVSDAIKMLRQFAAQVVHERREAKARGEETPKDVLEHILNEADKNTRRISVEDMVDHFLTLFVAGQETTSNQLAFTLFEIIKNPVIEERVCKEISDVIASKNSVDYEDLGKLQYLNQTLKESLRLHPPIGIFTRISPRGEQLGNYYIPAHTPVTFSTYIMHRHPALWDQPELFDPDRFSSQRQEDITNLKYFPFSLGPRFCIGQTLAQFEAKVVMARLLKEFKFELVPGQTAAVADNTLTLRPRDGVVCVVTRREY